MPKVRLNCLVCKKEFYQYLCNRKYNTVHCSMQCYSFTKSKRLKGFIFSTEHLRKIKETRLKNDGYNFSEEHIKHIAEANRKRDFKGAKNPNWKGGYDLKNAIRKTKPYYDWRRTIFERDNYTCVWCKQKGGRLNADHIKPFSKFPELRISLDNGRTLCENCHKLTDTYGTKARNSNQKNYKTS